MPDRTPDNRKDANTKLLDGTLRRNFTTQRLTNQQVEEIIALLQLEDRDFTAILRQRLKNFARRPFQPKTKKFKDLVQGIRGIRQESFKKARTQFKKNLLQLAKQEGTFEKELLAGSLPIVLEFNDVTSSTIRNIIQTRPLGDEGTAAGRTLDQWFQGLERADRDRILSAVQTGLFQGEGLDDIVRRVSGSRSLGFRDGALGLTRRQTEAIIRTAVNGITNSAREAVWLANAEVIDALMWVATLDGRTTPICQERDGHVTPLGDNEIPPGHKLLNPLGARPPAHVSCRSVMTAVFSQDGVLQAMGTRPFVRSTRTGRQRQLDFRQQAREQAGETWKNLTQVERNARVAAIRTQWGQENIGTIPATLTFEEWIKTQPQSFRDRIAKRQGLAFS